MENPGRVDLRTGVGRLAVLPVKSACSRSSPGGEFTSLVTLQDRGLTGTLSAPNVPVVNLDFPGQKKHVISVQTSN